MSKRELRKVGLAWIVGYPPKRHGAPSTTGRLPHTCAGDPAGVCDACDVAEDAAAVRREDR